MADMERLNARLFGVLNRLAKWRTVFTSWQLGTRPATDPTAAAVKDHREVTILLRAEVNAFTQLLIRKRVFSEAEWVEQLTLEAGLLNKAFEERFPGFRATDDGLDIDVEKARATMQGWPP